MRCIQSDDLALRAAVARLSGLSFAERLSLLKKLDNVSALALLSIEELCNILSIDKSAERIGRIPDLAQLAARAERDASIMKQYGVTMLLPGDEKYPVLLREIPQPPFALYCRGCVDILSNEGVGVVGTRHPDGAGIKAAFSFAKDCAEHGMNVVSGLAFGIDTAAHKGALDADCGKTVAVLGCGIDIIYPAANKRLAAEIIKRSGCIVSEYPPEEPGVKWHFPERNRIISGLTSATMVIEAPNKSGALITADFALEQGRDLCVHPAGVSFAKMLRQNNDAKKSFVTGGMSPSDKKNGGKTGGNKTDGHLEPGGVLQLVEDGAPVISSYSELKSLISGKMHQGMLDL
ncbi:MAG: DNA-processing protein DprA [Treponemataceae bacterium]|nr:DNA-processing protein DprA [Treponemataceae bacterium]